MVKDIYPKAECISMGITGLTVHTVYKNGEMKPKDVIGQSTVSSKQAWENAYKTIKDGE